MMSDSIKVAIKIRPLIKREKDENLPIQWITQENSIMVNDAEIKKRGDGRFTFDHIFDMDASNKDVFDSVVRPIVDATVNGFNGTVFAYGQTSSGKTYTMMGTSEEIGIIPLAVEHIFEAIANTSGREFLLRVSYLEIYKEKVYDLLTTDGNDLKIHEDTNGQVFVPCKEEVTNCPQNVLSIMNKGDKNRKIGDTNMNQKSSRSHTIFRITIESQEAGADSDDAIQVSQLNMVDLAGSEKARQTGATGNRFEEACHINLSLSTLALVIKQLSEPQESQKYVNFRDSKLTRLLQTSLGGNAMTAIICTITPAALDETQCTLSFASRAKNVKNKPQLNEVMSDSVLLKRYTKQIDKLQTELKKLKQLAPDFQEMESRIQEKDRLNQNLEERIELLQTKIVHGDTRNNPETFKSRVKRRQTWCGSGVSKLDTFVPWTNLAPIQEMSPCKLHDRKSVDTMDTSFQIVYPLTDFEEELMKNEEALENDSDDDFITYRRQNRVKFKDDVIMHKSPTSNDSCISEKIDISTQTTGPQSPGTPKQSLRDRIDHLSKEYSQLEEFTTLEKQLFVEDYNCETKEKLTRLLTLEKQLENITSDKDAFEHIAAKLRKELTAAEVRYTLAEDQLNAQVTELQRIPDLEKKIAQLTAQEMEVQNIPELQKQVAFLTAEKNESEHITSELRRKLNEVEQRSILLENKLAMQKSHTSDTEESFIQLSSKNENVQQIKTELETQNITIFELQEKLKEAELCNNSIKEQFNVQQVELLKTIDEQKKCIENFTIERSKLENASRELQEKSRETELHNNLLKDKINEQELQLQTIHNLEREIESLTSKSKESECTIYELQEKLIKTEQCTSAKDEQLQKIQELEAQITILMSEREEYEQEFMKFKSLLMSQMEDTHSKEPVSTNSMTLDHDCEDMLLNNGDSSKMIEDLSITRISLEDDGAKLSADLLLKNQEIDEIKHDVQSLKADIEKLQDTIYLLTTENSELANKLTEEKECAKKSAVCFQQTIDKLYARNSKITDENYNLENNLALLNEQIETLRSKTSEQNLSEEQINLKYEERINTLTVKNSELLSNIADAMKELETLKESKSLLYEHDCMYKDKLTDIVEKCEHLTTENNELSIDLMCQIEENDELRQECNILKDKLELSLKNANINDNDVEQLKAENTLLKTELMELKANMKVLNEENSKMSDQLVETLEDLDNTRKINSCSNDLNSSMLLNISTMNDRMDETIKEDTAEAKILKLQEEINNLTRLNRKLSDLKSSACTECVCLKELSNSIKDKLNAEEMKGVELNNQITELHNKNSALTEEMNALKDDYLTLQRKSATLEKKVRSSISKVQAEEQIDELKDLNKSLRNHLDGAGNRITELQANNTDLMKQLVTLNSQYETMCKDNQELKETLSSYKFKYNDASTKCENCVISLQELNKVALELEATKVQLNQKNQEVEHYTNKIMKLTEKNTEFDEELEELTNVIRKYDVENTKLEDKYYTCRNEIKELQKKIQDLENKNQDLQLQSVERNVSSDRAEKSHDVCNCTTLQNKIRELQLEIVWKNGKIATLELQIQSESFPYQMKCRELQELLSTYKNKNSKLKAEIKRLMLSTSMRECDVCKQRFVNRRTQACQTISTNLVRFCGSNSGIIDDEVKIAKLEKEKEIMKNICRSRSKTIKELEQRIQELEHS
ncbi:uncharacterized protein [Linepithema humile]|uniref:uncharacterized protein isoform X1 n=2 Tax=Linepithema humile TaxID=83485 RepID=UPI00351DACDD